MPPKKSKSKDTGNKRTSEKCVFYNRGYCKSREECEKHHSDKVCNDINCNEKECMSRHPNPCLFGARCTFNKRQECLYSHVTFASDDERIQALKNNFNEQFKKMETNLKHLEHELEKKDSKIKLLEENQNSLEEAMNKFQVNHKKTVDRMNQMENKLKKMDEKQGTFEKELSKPKNISSVIVAEKLNLKCDKCKFTTESENGLKVHKQRKHSKLDYPPYDCEFCDETFGTKDLLEKHLKVHSFKKVIKCGNCSFLASNNLSLNVHEGKMHSGDFECGLCGFEAEDNDNLEIHLHTCKTYTCCRTEYTYKQLVK